MLTQQETNQIVGAVSQWAARAPNQPVLAFASGAFKRPREILLDMVEGNEDGQALLEILEHVVRRVGIEKVVAKFEGDTPNLRVR